ncbi:TMV resistance protein N isoform X2 [Cryptomeria japonica]|uniref:TMV resistance protein N isoform X2 n=1 Tax=Cryptomeria japonica TaxID=3369 RepID=UPI0027D9F6B1|nr:TMV resistance protein N isoform X2 [Cryptomeria japonica]
MRFLSFIRQCLIRHFVNGIFFLSTLCVYGAFEQNIMEISLSPPAEVVSTASSSVLPPSSLSPASSSTRVLPSSVSAAFEEDMPSFKFAASSSTPPLLTVSAASSSAPPPPSSVSAAYEEVVPSSLSAAFSSAPLLPATSYDVFINHYGEDVKYTLATNIHDKLTALGFSVFLDVYSLELGDVIPAHIEEAMRTASLHIAIFSPKYVESPWCLAELAYMLNTPNRVIPVFYRVDPSDLRWVGKGKGSYAPSFSRHEKQGRYSAQKVEEWKMALEKISFHKGFVVKDNKDEGLLLKKIVNMVLLGKVPLPVTQNSVGLDDVVLDFERNTFGCAQGERNVQIVGIVGMGGIGKTTLAKELYNRKSSSFHSCCFVFAVRDAASRNALHEKQKKLLEDIGVRGLTFDNIDEGKAILANRLRSLRALIVLDDVDDETQLDALLPTKDCLGSGSLVIVTTRELHLLDKWDSKSYRMNELDYLNAKALFCRHAFPQGYPEEGFAGIVEKFLKTCNGLPLSLEVFGRLVYGRPKDYWKSQLHKISRTLPEDIKGRLSVSYNSLDEEEKEMFMDVASFFLGQHRDSAIEVWDELGWSGLQGWEKLVNKCLVNVDEHDSITMHDHLRDLGRDLASRHSSSRVCLPESTFNIEKQATGRSIRGIVAAGLEYTDEPFCHQQRPKKFWRALPFSPRLKLSTGKEAKLMKDFATPSDDLVWLHVLDFKKRNLPSWLSFRMLRYLKLRNAVNLRYLWPNTDDPPLRLRELCITNGHILQTIPTSIGLLKELKRIQLFHCKAMKNLPEEFCSLSSLEWLDLCYCEMLSSLPSGFGVLTNLRHIDLCNCKRLQSLPVSFKQLRNLQYLNFCFCEQLSFRLDMLEKMGKLEYLNFSFFSNLVELPNGITGQVYLRELHVCYTGLREVPTNIGQLHKLETLEIGSSFLNSLPSSIENLSSLTQIELGGSMFNSVPYFVERLNMLKKIEISGTGVFIISLPADCCPSLETLILDDNNELKCIDSLPTLLQGIEVASCRNLKSIEGIRCLRNLRILRISDCTNLDEPSSFPYLHSLDDISISNCDKFLEALAMWKSRGIRGWEDMEKLKTLELVANNTSALQLCTRDIKKWPWQTCIVGRAVSSVESVMESLSFPNLTVIGEREELLEYGKTHSSGAAIVCLVVKVFEDHFIDHPFLPFSKTSVLCWRLRRGQWVFVGVWRQDCNLLDTLGRIARREVNIKIKERVVAEEERVMVMAGEEKRVVQGFTHLWPLFT